MLRLEFRAKITTNSYDFLTIRAAGFIKLIVVCFCNNSRTTLMA